MSEAVQSIPSVIVPIGAMSAYSAAANADRAQPLQARLGAWLDNLTPCTQYAYRRELVRFAAWLGGINDVVMTTGAAIEALCHAHRFDPRPKPTLLMLEQYRDHLLSTPTAGGERKTTGVQRSIAALNSCLKMCAKAGIGPGPQQVTIDKGKQNVVRGSRKGPQASTVTLMLGRVAERGDRYAVRDTAILALLAKCALRRQEVCNLDVADFDADARTIQVLGKGRKAKEPMPLAQSSADAIAAWLRERATFAKSDESALFVGINNRSRGTRMSGHAVWLIVKRAAETVKAASKGSVIRPHGLRHTAATAIIENSNGNMVLAQHVLRHSDVSITSKMYDDSGDKAKASGIEILERVI